MDKKVIKRLALIIIIFISIIPIVTVGSAIKIRSTEAYRFAKEYIIKNEEIHKRTGDILAFGSFPSGLVEEGYTSVNAQIEIDIEGSKWSGKIIILMDKPKKSNKWNYKEVYYKDK